MKANHRNIYLFRNTLLFAFGNIGSRLIGFLLIPIYTSLFTTSDFGTIDLVVTISAIIVPILTLNIGEAVMRFSLDENAEEKKIMGIAIIVLFASTIGGLLLFPITNKIDTIRPFAVFIYLYFVTLGIDQILFCFLRGKEKLLQYSISYLIQSILYAFFSVLFLLILKLGVKGYFSAFILSNIISALYAFFAGNVKDAIKNIEVDFQLSRKMIAYSVVLIPNSFMWWVMNSSDRVMIASMVGVAANGVYAVAYKIPSLLSTVTTVFTQAWSYSAIREDKSNDKEEYFNIIYDNIVTIVLIAGTGILMIIKPFLKFYVGTRFYQAWEYTPYLVIGFVFMTLGSFLSSSYTVNKDSKGFLKSGLVGAVINILLNWLLIPRIGVSGAALATCISYFVVYLFRVIDTRKYVKIHVYKKNHILGFIMLFITGITLFIDLEFSQTLLTFEFIMMILIFRVFVVSLVSVILVRMKEVGKVKWEK